MSNILEIKGKKTGKVNPATNVSIELTAYYQNTQYDFTKLTGIIPDAKMPALTLHFTRSDKKEIPDGLNKIILITFGNSS